MPLTKVRWKHGRNEHEAPVAEFLAAAEADPMFPVPYPVARAMLAEDTERPDEGLSVTNLLSGCKRCKVLEKYTDFAVEVPRDLWYRWKGTMFHTVLEENGNVPGAIIEVRFFGNLPNGELIHGKPDLILPDTIVDLKTTRQVPLYGSMWKNHEQQLNIYRWLINNAASANYEGNDLGFLDEAKARNFRRLVIWYIDPDNIKVIESTKTVAKATKKGAASPYRNVREPYLWTDEEVEGFLVGAYADLAEAFELYETEGRLPPYPPDFDYIGGWEHRYSPVARLCVESYIAEQTERKVA